MISIVPTGSRMIMGILETFDFAEVEKHDIRSHWHWH